MYSLKQKLQDAVMQDRKINRIVSERMENFLEDCIEESYKPLSNESEFICSELEILAEYFEELAGEMRCLPITAMHFRHIIADVNRAMIEAYTTIENKEEGQGNAAD